MLDRRTFLIAGGSSLTLLGRDAPLRAQGATVTRRSVRGMSANDPDLAAMRRAVARMKALPQSDPRNWLRFADIHRNFCPHANWYFLPWHRAYIRSFERICQELSGKSDFALPYWNWTADRQFPAAFAAGDRDSNPLFHPRPGVASGLRLTDDMVGPAVMSDVMNSPDFEAFGSTRPRGQNSAAASWQRRAGSATVLEFNPHNSVHQAIGGNMAVIDLSSRDPIFFLHHSNVDRIWTAWNRRGNANSPEPMWRDFVFDRNFLEPGGSPWNVGVGELGSPAALGYRYDDDDGPFAADLVMPAGDLMTEKLHAYRRLDPGAMAGVGDGLRRIELPSGGAIHAAVADNDQIASRDRPIGISVPLGRPLGDILGPQALAFRPDRPDARKYRRYVWAALRDIEQPLDATTRLRVFVNCHELSPRTRLNDPSYATSVSFFGGEHASHGGAGERGGASVYVDLTQALARMDHPRSLRADRLTVQLLPNCANNEANVSNIRPRRVEVVIL
ncbi:MAG: tyrosinase [Alphaproteobacteria bacterium]|jgi:tyrosinase|nr:tyrosinase [Alphaproteobacteria bacterium]MEA3025506.1 tyrosinase [Alphaproteobacteria bacterium]